MIDPRFRRAPGVGVGAAARALARRQAGQLTLVRRRAQPSAVYIARLTGPAVLAYLLARLLPGSSGPVLAPPTALLVVQATWFRTIRSAIRSVVQRVAGVTAGVLAAVAVAAYVPFSWSVLGLLIAATLALGMVLRLREAVLEVPISAMLIFSVDSHAAATGRITDTLVGAAAGLGASLVFAPLRVQPAKDVVGELSRPGTLASRNNLAAAYRAAGDLGRAIPLYEQTLADSERVLGPDHPQTKIVRGNLAAARQHPQRPAPMPYREAAGMPGGRKHAASDLG